MAAMTKERLLEAIHSFAPEQRANSINLPAVLSFTAAKLWVDRVPEDENTELIRQAIKDLGEHGCFQWQTPDSY